MKTLYWILTIIILGFVGYYAFYAGWALVRIFIGLMFVAVFASGVVVGQISNSRRNEK